MKKHKKILLIFFILLLPILPWYVCFSQETHDDIVITTQRLSDRVLVLSETVMGNNVVAVASEKGVVVIDDSGLPSTAARMRGIIEKEFARNDFIYVINTHSHWDHSFGNQIFPDADIIGHENVPAGMEQDKAIMPQRITSLEQRLQDEINRLKEVQPGSEESRNIQALIGTLDRQLKDFKNNYVSTPPNILFSDRMELDLGDLTVRLVYFGRAHSTSDIFIQIPEERILMTGDLFLDQRWVPLFAGQPELDIDRWLEVLHRVLDGDNSPGKVIPGHMDIWEAEKLALWRDYIKILWEGMKKAKEQGLSLEEIKEKFPLQKPYYYLRERGHSDDRILRFHDNNIEAFWRQLFISAADTIENIIKEQGIRVTRERLQEMKMNPGKYLISEGEFNAIGYQLVNAGQMETAIAVFKLNVELYPESSNAYDSLGEAFMKSGDKNNAIKNYQKSLELNHGNDNAREMLKSLEKK